MNILQEFLASRAKDPDRKVVTNEAQVSRADFDKLANMVGTIGKAVETLITDVEVATSPEKLTAAFNEALKPLMNGLTANGRAAGGLRPPLALKADYGFLAPPGDDDLTVNAKGSRPPLALKADKYFDLAPKGD